MSAPSATQAQRHFSRFGRGFALATSIFAAIQPRITDEVLDALEAKWNLHVLKNSHPTREERFELIKNVALLPKLARMTDSGEIWKLKGDTLLKELLGVPLGDPRPESDQRKGESMTAYMRRMDREVARWFAGCSETNRISTTSKARG